jgi:hypothetical protein
MGEIEGDIELAGDGAMTSRSNWARESLENLKSRNTIRPFDMSRQAYLLCMPNGYFATGRRPTLFHILSFINATAVVSSDGEDKRSDLGSCDRGALA